MICVFLVYVCCACGVCFSTGLCVWFLRVWCVCLVFMCGVCVWVCVCVVCVSGCVWFVCLCVCVCDGVFVWVSVHF